MLAVKGQEYDKKRGKEVGADVYMTKPLDPDEVAEKVVEVLGFYMIGTRQGSEPIWKKRL